MTAHLRLLCRLTVSVLFFIPFLRAEGSDWKIVLPDSPAVVEQTAADELQTHIEQMTGEKVPICAESETSQENGHLLLVGRTKIGETCAAAEHPEPFQFDEIFIKAEGTNLILIGHPQRGTLYAVYTFLEDVCGCRWFTEEVSRIPKLEQISFPANLKISYAPKLIFRQIGNPIANRPVFSARNKGNGGVDEAHGGRIDVRYWCHTFYRYINPDVYFADHPEWFSEIDGKRTCERAQLCLTNDEMRKELTKNVLEDIRQHPETKIIDISQNDYFNYCTCEKCRAVDEEEGSHSGTLIRFLNQVGADIEKEFPDVQIETLIYQYTRKPPKLVKPRKNLLLRLCSIECDFGRPLDGPTNTDFQSDLETWAQLAEQLFIWDYVTNYNDLVGPHPNWDSLGPNIRDFVNHRVTGLYEEGEGFDFDEMKIWVLLKLMWNPNLDTKQLMAEFSDTYYGKEATPYIMEYWRILEERILKSGAKLGCFFAHSWTWLDLDTINAATVQMKKAEEVITKNYGADSPEYAHFRRSRTAIDSVWVLRYGQLKQEAEQRGIAFEGPDDITAAAKEFANYCLEHKFHAPDLDDKGEAGVKWYQETGNGEHTPMPVAVTNSNWSISGNGTIEDGKFHLDGTGGRAVALGNTNQLTAEMFAEFQIEPNQKGHPSFGVVFGAKDSGTYSYLQFDGDRVTVGSSRSGEEPNIIFDKPGRPHAVGEKHTLHILFREKLISVYIDDETVFQWLSYPCPDEKEGKIGFFADGGKVQVWNISAAGKKL